MRESQPQDPLTFEDPRKEVRVILNPADVKNIEISSQVLLDDMFTHINKKESKFEDETLKQITEMREVPSKKRSWSRIIIAGMGPTGLLTILEAYSAGASIIGVELRSQYTRPQILRLTPDTINRLAFFAGRHLWSYFLGLGYISRSPNWSINKYDFTNQFLYPKIRDLQKKIWATPDQAEKDKFSR